jgi:hypothetical protein
MPSSAKDRRVNKKIKANVNRSFLILVRFKFSDVAMPHDSLLIDERRRALPFEQTYYKMQALPKPGALQKAVPCFVDRE